MTALPDLSLPGFSATKGSKLTGHSRNGEQRTPDYIYSWLNWRFRFNLDAAASHENFKADTYCTAAGTFHCSQPVPGVPSPSWPWDDRDGLGYPWAGARVFVNPPYSKPLLLQFVKKAVAERNQAEIIVMLVKYDPSCEHGRLLREFAHLEYLPRVSFDDEHGNARPAATFPNVVAIFRPDPPAMPKGRLAKIRAAEEEE